MEKTYDITQGSKGIQRVQASPIRAILDQLDRQTGGAAFDPDAGWRELQTRRPAKRRRLGRYPVVLAAVLVCLAVAGTALAVNLGLHEKLAALFPADEETQALVPGLHRNTRWCDHYRHTDRRRHRRHLCHLRSNAS